MYSVHIAYAQQFQHRAHEQLGSKAKYVKNTAYPSISKFLDD